MTAAPVALTAAEITSDVWLISGQSNACGWAVGEGHQPDPRVQIYDPAKRAWAMAAEPLALLHGTGVGPWHSAALVVAQGGIKVGLTGFADPGKPIANWDPGAVDMVGLERSIHEQGGEGAGVFLWYQGESDANTAMDTPTYQAKLRDLIARVRKSARNPTMTAVIIQLAYWGPSVANAVAIREAQRCFVIDDGNALLVPALGLPMQGDGGHLTREGYFSLGERIAKALLKTRYHRKDIDWPGPVLDAATLGQGGTVMAHFAETKRIAACAAGDFCVLDKDGVNTCTEAQAQGTRVALSFARPVKPPARLVVGYGQAIPLTLADEAGNPGPAAILQIAAGAVPGDGVTSAPNGAGRPSEAGMHTVNKPSH